MPVPIFSQFTSYVDGVNRLLYPDAETRRPDGSIFHLNQYQIGGLDGGPIENSNPPPTGLNVETTGWGQDAEHGCIDDLPEVTSRIKAELKVRVSR